MPQEEHVEKAAFGGFLLNTVGPTPHHELFCMTCKEGSYSSGPNTFLPDSLWD